MDLEELRNHMFEEHDCVEVRGNKDDAVIRFILTLYA